MYLGYSGHGAHLAQNADYGFNENLGHKRESDGQDEVMCLVRDRFSGNNSVENWLNSLGFIKDDWLTENFCNKIPAGAEAFVMFDCCHSGTLLELPYSCNNKMYKNDASDARCHKVNGDGDIGKLVFLSGCKDNQTSADIGSGGALTLSFLKLVRSKSNIKMEDFIIELHTRMRDFSQRPQLSANFKLTNKDTFADMFDGLYNDSDNTTASISSSLGKDPSTDGASLRHGDIVKFIGTLRCNPENGLNNRNVLKDDLGEVQGMPVDGKVAVRWQYANFYDEVPETELKFERRG